MREYKFRKTMMFLFMFLFMFSISSCSGNKYDDGDLCGIAEVGGDNAFSKMREVYVEQYVYELNKPTEEDLKKDDATKYDLYNEKYQYNEEEKKFEVIEPTNNLYIQSHYLFTFYDKEYGNKYYETVIEYVDSRVNEKFTQEDADNYKKILEECAIKDNNSYFKKINNKDLDGDQAENRNGQAILSVKSRLQSHSRACIVFQDGFVDPSTGVIIPKTTWGDAWKSGFFNGLFVYPLSALINVFVDWFGGAGISQMFAILVVTAVLKILIFLITFKSQSSAQKMQDVQPEIAKIQAKYGQSPTPEQKQRMAMELMSIYKKYGISPFAPFVSLIITFPVFIAMYRAVMYLGILRTGQLGGVVMGNNLNAYIIGQYAFNWVAFVIFIVMAASQILTMKLPQILNRKRMTPEAKKAQSQMGMFTNIMMITILVMGFMMPVTMSVYWIASALVSTAQSLIMHKLNNVGKKGRYKMKKVDDDPIDIPQGYKTN